jgi:hypothetical protein
MARARIHKTQPPRAHRAPIETILQAPAVHVAFKGMAKVFDLPPNGLLASAAPCNGVPAYNRLGEWPGTVTKAAARRGARRLAVDAD